MREAYADFEEIVKAFVRERSELKDPITQIPRYPKKHHFRAANTGRVGHECAQRLFSFSSVDVGELPYVCQQVNELSNNEFPYRLRTG